MRDFLNFNGKSTKPNPIGLKLLTLEKLTFYVLSVFSAGGVVLKGGGDDSYFKDCTSDALAIQKAF